MIGSRGAGAATPCGSASYTRTNGLREPGAIPVRLMHQLQGTMPVAPGTKPVLLIAARREHVLQRALEPNRYAVVQVHTGTLALEWARDLRPDTIILEADLPDMSGIAACRQVHNDLRIGHNVPILILAPHKPTPEQRVAALRAGAWDILDYQRDPEEISLKLQTYVQAKRNIDLALAEGLVDPVTGLHSRTALARRARELGSLMSRRHGALACIVFLTEAEAADPQVGRLVARAARVSDVVGALSPTEYAVLAPATDQGGAVRLAQRVASAVRAGSRDPVQLVPGSTLWAGYEAVDNLTYSPTDPVSLLARAAAAVRGGSPEPGYPWVRRFDRSLPLGHEAGATARTTPPGLVFDERRTSV